MCVRVQEMNMFYCTLLYQPIVIHCFVVCCDFRITTRPS